MVGPIARGFACAVALTATIHCAPEPPRPRLRLVTPARAYTDKPLRLILGGEQLVPSFHLDLAAGERTAETTGFEGWVGTPAGTVPLVEFGWRSDQELSATLMPGLPAGLHTVVVVDPRGARTELEEGFTSLGLDRTPPEVKVVQPGQSAPLAGGGPLHVTLEIKDEGSLGHVAWQVDAGGRLVGAGSCLVPGGARQVRCDFEVLLPRDLQPGQAVELQAVASDAAQPANTLSVRREFTLGDPPSVARVDPPRGGTGGGTDVLVTGARFVPGSKVFFGRVMLSPDGGIHLDERTITGRAPPNASGTVDVRVVTPIGDGRLVSGFQYLSPPALNEVQPAQGSRSGGYVLRVRGMHFTARTRIHLGPSLRASLPLTTSTLVSAEEMVSLVAPMAGTAPAPGPVSVFAVDPDSGVSQPLVDGFTWMGP